MKKIIFNPGSFGLFVIFAIMFGLSLHNTSQKAKITRDQLRQLETETSLLESSVASKSTEASRSAHAFTKEKIARDELLWLRPGEVVMELPPITSKPEVQVVTPTQTPLEAWKALLK